MKCSYENITSSKEILIKQGIYSQVLESNILQAFINDNDKNINQEKYKNKMETNANMSGGIFKNTLIYILLEDDNQKSSKMIDKFCATIEKYVVPIKPERKNQRNKNPKNRYHINQRKHFNYSKKDRILNSYLLKFITLGVIFFSIYGKYRNNFEYKF